ncbi:CHAT domain-containing protein [Apiospora rasikravindrae]|uniref:CHAT domain-containing protein n=1 Tax=Apiospora rasikravindrae TaxID=990691 RepID=A0ABR1RPC1_9PEZI
MLETSCGVLMGSLYDLRTDVSVLEKSHPDLAGAFISLRAKLDGPASRNPLQATAEDPISAAQREGDQRREAAARLEITVQEIRSLPGFDQFLLPPSEAEVFRAAEHGPIVIVNVSTHRCDALVVERSGMRSLELPQLSRQDVEEKEPQSLDTLVWLWDTIVSPVLVELGLTQAAADSAPQHIWWIPIGPLVRFPLHAAGDHLSGHRNTALDRVVSSYSSSVRAIIHGRQQRLASLTADQIIALVAMENTPGVGYLDFAVEEINKVRAVCESMRIKPLQPGLCKQEVLSALQTCSIFHFAGHGSTHPANPLQSQLLLQDWEKDPFTVANLLEMIFGSASPFLAYLSACGTGQVLNKGLINEGIHLTAAYQLAGFRHVIGTLWSIDDRLCVDMARMVYEFLQIEGVQNSNMSDGAVSRALHYAMRALRDEWRTQMEGGSNVSRQVTRDERDAVMYDVEVGKVAALWVPYVHFGV